MSKTKKAETGHYEILFIIPNKFTEDEGKKVITKVEKMIEGEGGKITFSEYWGKKRLAYKIKHNEYGYYALYEFDLERINLAKIDKDLRLSTEILRHQIVLKKVKSEEEIKREAEIRAKIDSKKSVEDKKLADKKEKIAKETSKEAKKVVSSDEGKADLKDLDEKLEGILNADDLI